MNDKYKEYANKVLGCEIKANNLIKLACRRYIDWFHRQDIEFSSEKVDKAIKFISKFHHYTGKSNGQPFILSEWQIFIIANIFGWYYKDTDKRVIKNVYIEVGRKAGKSALISVICLYCLIADGENGSEVDCVANTRQQAKILFDMASNFTRQLDGKQKYLKAYRDKIKFNATQSFMQVLSSDAATLDGFNAYCFVQDELHAAKDSKLYDVLKSSQGMRDNPLAICITSAGFNKFGFCFKMRQTCVEILNGVKVDDSQFAAIYALDEDDDWTDEDNWVKANPNIDITVSREYLREQVTQAKNNPSLEVSVRTKNFGQWVSASDIWISNDELVEVTQDVVLTQFSTDDVGYVGVDLSSVSDLTSMSIMIPKDGKFYFKTKYYLPESALEGNSNAEMYKQWVRQGKLTITNGNVVDYDYILKDLLAWNELVYIAKVSYDEYNATQWAINATTEGLPLVPYSQALWNFNKPTKEMERLIKQKSVVIDNNEMTRWCFTNAILKIDHNNNCKPIKEIAQNKIDGCISMIEALGGYLEDPQYNNVI